MLQLVFTSYNRHLTKNLKTDALTNGTLDPVFSWNFSVKNFHCPLVFGVYLCN